LNFLVGRLSRLVTYPTMLLNRHGDALLRIKGTLNVADAATPVAVHAVQHWCIRHGTWRHGPMRTDSHAWYSSPAGEAAVAECPRMPP
jgi:hypothetical protein